MGRIGNHDLDSTHDVDDAATLGTVRAEAGTTAEESRPRRSIAHSS
jgi:hypothetical protein